MNKRIYFFSIGLVLIFTKTFGQAPKREVLYTKSCDTVSVDSIVCIKCSNPELTLNCKRYICDYHDHCIVIGVIPNNRLKDTKSTKVTTTKKN